MSLIFKPTNFGNVKRATIAALLAWCVLSSAAFSQAEDESSRKEAASAPNAAVIYWQAFAAIPSLKDDERKALDAATASASRSLPQEVRWPTGSTSRPVWRCRPATSIPPA